MVVKMDVNLSGADSCPPDKTTPPDGSRSEITESGVGLHEMYIIKKVSGVRLLKVECH